MVDDKKNATSAQEHNDSDAAVQKLSDDELNAVAGGAYCITVVNIEDCARQYIPE